jgi:hypothetical protein
MLYCDVIFCYVLCVIVLRYGDLMCHARQCIGMGHAYLRGPACAVDTEWEESRSMNLKTFLVNNGKWEAMQVECVLCNLKCTCDM